MHKGIDYTGITISFLCHDGHGNVLMSFRSTTCRDEHNCWDFGSGALEFGADVEQTLCDEIWQEYRARIISHKFMGFRELHRMHAGKPTHWIALDFHVHIEREGVENGEPHKFERIEWFTLDTLPTPVHSQTHIFLEKNKHFIY